MMLNNIKNNKADFNCIENLKEYCGHFRKKELCFKKNDILLLINISKKWMIFLKMDD